MKARYLATVAVVAMLAGIGVAWWRGQQEPPEMVAAPEAPAAESAPEAAPAETSATPAETAESASPTGVAPATPASEPAVPAFGPGGDGPAYWPLVVPVGPDGNALAPAPQRSGWLAPPSPPLHWRRDHAVMQPAIFRPGAGRAQVILARGPGKSSGPIKLTPIGPGTHSIPPSGKSYGAAPGGGKGGGSGGRMTIEHGDGSTDSWGPEGYTHIDPPDPDGGFSGYTINPDGSRDGFAYDRDGNGVLVQGGSGDIKRINPDGSVTYDHPDGTRETIDPDGNRTIDLDPPPGDIPSATGPADGPGPGGAGGIGEPHFLTFDGTPFMSQAVGEFVLAQGVAGQDLQVRLQPYGQSRSVSAIAGFAIRAGGAVVQVLADGSVRIDGALAGPGEALRYDLPEGGALGLWRNGGDLAHVVLIWPDLSTLWIDRRPDYLNFSVSWRRPEDVRRGMLGRDDGMAANDLTARDGTEADPADADAVRAFVDSWRVGDEESLFSYDEGEGTADFTDTGFPYAQPEAAHGALAKKACARVAEGFARDACLFDVSVTGEVDFAASAGLAATRQAVLDRGKAPPAPDRAKAVQPAAVLDADCKALGDDPAGAAALEGSDVTVALDAGQSRLYRLETTGGITVFTRGDSAYSGEYQAGKAGYCVFDAQGGTVIPLTDAGTDSAFSTEDQDNIPAGTYYLKVLGAGEARLTVMLGN